ncbi:MAG: hypothetical protein KJO55_03610 [Gammaproteobacteria bacterium]|nr:hypothetical protein [Gammaproteobacteria bacterium]NND59061.1 hypothetical protein [Gammaproteobacteria bacterium]
MERIVLLVTLLSLAGVTHAYSIKYSYPGKNGATEFYGECDNGAQLKVTQHTDGTFAFEGPTGSGTLSGSKHSIDSAAAAACGE